MSRLALPLLLILLHHSRSAYVTPSFAARLDQLYEKLERLNQNIIQKTQDQTLYDKIEKLNALAPERDLTDDDEELLQAMQMWGMMDPEQMDGVVKDLQSVREEEYRKSDKLDSEDSDGDWNELLQPDEDKEDLPEGDYPGDYPDEEPDSSTSRPDVITPSTLTRLGPKYKEMVVSAVDPIAATNERPTIVDDSNLTPRERAELRKAAFANIAAVVKGGKCQEPQARWFIVRHLAPAANIVYLPPCVQLHRCAPDSGCCHDEGEVCAPLRGDYVEIPFYLQKADGNRHIARMRFFNHTDCACVSRDTLQTTVRSRVEEDNIQKKKSRDSTEEARQRQNDWRPSTEEPRADDEDHTAPPQLRRCTCPRLFLAQPLNEGVCSCVCDWPDPTRRRDCLSFARGREHFGMTDRVCVARGDCNAPTCEYGAYERSLGKCPQRRFRRLRYYHHRKLADNTSD